MLQIEEAAKVRKGKDQAHQELDALKVKVAEANHVMIHVQGMLDNMTRSFHKATSIAQAQGVEWFLGSDAFQNVVAVATINMTIEIYNDVRDKVLRYQPNFLKDELAFTKGKQIDEQGKSLVPLFETAVKVLWTLDEEGASLCLPTILEKGEEFDFSQSFVGWDIGMPNLEGRISSPL
ncbi:hypothetical protein SLEP1_g9128 [Rubroshorea leprosula]|uniref:Uncharacterized protein n=1 Tax=Rubroshorea leprosula TaxID=152421 RepID=A0AAV5I8G5_9ROSI|nr:hypothetical protein SLEP1_g9128 [Rubroshorea leprosula]